MRRMSFVVCLLCLSVTRVLDTAPGTGQQISKEGTETEEVADAIALNLKVMQLYQAGKYSEAIPLAQKHVSFVEKPLGPDHGGLHGHTVCADTVLYARGRGKTNLDADSAVRHSS